MSKWMQRLWALLLVAVLSVSNVVYAVEQYAGGTDTVTYDGSIAQEGPAENAVDADRETYFILDDPAVSGKTITIDFAQPHKGMKLVSGQVGAWSDHISAPADIYVKVGEDYVKTDSINTPGGVSPVKEAEGVLVHTVSFGGYEASQVQVRFTGNAGGWMRIREIEGVDTLELQQAAIAGLPQDGATLKAITVPALVSQVSYAWTLNGQVVSQEPAYKVKSTDVGSISLSVTFGGKTLTTDSFPIVKSYTTLQGQEISHEGLREELNGEQLNLANAVDGNTDTMANINNTQDLMDKTITVRYAQAPTGLRILSGNPSDKLTAPVEILLSEDGVNFTPAQMLTAGFIAQDDSVRTHEIAFANPQGCCYVKLRFAADSPDGWTRIREIYGLNGVIKESPEQPRDNLALDAQATASGNETAGFSQDKANDGDLSTRWSSAVLSENAPQWLCLDFGTEKTFNCVKLFWERSGGKAYEVQVSQDGADWQTVGAVTDGQPGETKTLNFDPVTARYVRVYVTENFPDIWNCVSIYEMEVYNHTWAYILEQAKKELQDAQSWNGLSQDVNLITTTQYGASVTWSCQSEYLKVENGVLKVTRPQNTTSATLEAVISYGENSETFEIPVMILSDRDLQNTYDLNPTPQRLEMRYTLIPFDNVKVYYEDGISQVTRSRVEEVLNKQGVSFTVTESYEEATLALGIHGSGGAVDGAAQGYSQDLFTPGDGKYDIHFVDINENGRVTILGQHDDAVYYGLATLEAAMETVAGQNLACAVVEDYANMQYRGIVEGFYGKVYSVEDILSLFDYMEENKMNTFVYGPKGDPYHLGNWRDAYPTEITEEQRFYGMMTQGDMQKLAAAAAANNISFVWSIHPAMQNGINFLDRDSVNAGIDAILNKFSQMYDLGIRQFGIFVDDIDLSVAYRGSENQAYMIAQVQQRLEETYNQSPNPADHVLGTFYVPSYYALDFGNREQLKENLNAFREQNQDNNVIMMMTGSGCWSSVNNDALKTIREYTGKKPVMWWNYPVNDNIDDQLYMNRLNSVYGTSLDVVDGMGILSNPMNQAEASKVSLYGVADYTWNTASFDVQGNWEESFQSYTADPALQDALRLFASHAAKNQDHTDINTLFQAYKQNPEDYKPVLERMEALTQACQTILDLENSSDPKLVKLLEEIRPWVYRLRDMSQMIVDSILAIHGDEDERSAHLMNVVRLANGIDSLDKYKVESLEGQGTTQTISNYITAPGNLYILPFARYIANEAVNAFLSGAAGPFAYTHSLIDGFPVVRTGSTYAAEGEETVTVLPGGYLAYDLAQLVELESITGMDQGKVQVSLDGKTWTDYTPGVQARYVRMCSDSQESLSVPLKDIRITAKVWQIASVTTNREFWQPSEFPTGNLSDYNANTFVWLTSQAVGTQLVVTYDQLVSLNRMELTTTTDGDRLQGQVTFAYLNGDGEWVDVAAADSDEFVDGSVAVDFPLVQAKAIRMTVTESRSTNWLKIVEFHGVSTKIKSAVTVNGVGESKLTDRDMMTFLNLEGEGEIVMYVYESRKAEALVVYNASDLWDGVQVYAVTPEGEVPLTWDPQTSTAGCRRYPTQGLKGVTAFRVAYAQEIYINELEIQGERYVVLNLNGMDALLAEAKAEAAKDGYTQASVDALNQAIQALENLIADHLAGEPYTREELDQAADGVRKAIEGLEEAVEPTDPSEPTDPTKPTDPSEPTKPTESSEATKPTETTKPATDPEGPSQTGESFHPVLLAALLLTSAACLGVILVKSRKWKTR